MTCVPKVGDRVVAHSKGKADTDYEAVYTDWEWFPGKITKVDSPPPCEDMLVCILYFDALTETNNACLGDRKRNAWPATIFV